MLSVTRDVGQPSCIVGLLLLVGSRHLTCAFDFIACSLYLWLISPSSLRKLQFSHPSPFHQAEAKVQDGGRLRRKDSRPLKKTTISVIRV